MLASARYSDSPAAGKIGSRAIGGSRPMGSAPPPTERKIHFGPFDVTDQVFLTTPYSFAVVNLKPLLPGHVLVCPLVRHKRMTDLSAPELTDLMLTVQKVQRLLAHHYFQAQEAAPLPSKHHIPGTRHHVPAPPEDGSFNIAVQDGDGAGQTVPHLHVHVIPRIRDVSEKDGAGEGDSLYERMAEEEGNVGGALWDEAQEAQRAAGGRRPSAGGKFSKIEDSMRRGRDMDDMIEEVEEYKETLREMGLAY